MMRQFKTVTAGILSALILATSSAPAGAVVMPSVKAPAASDVEQVQARSNGRPGLYKGYRGSRERRPGYRRHSDGFWYPLAAFGAAAIIGGAIANQPRASSRHVQWCADRYRTYRASDNTYVPRAGVRAQCNSPYSR